MFASAQYDDDEPISDDNTRVTEDNDRTIVSNTLNPFDGMKISTVNSDLMSSDGGYTRQPWPFLSTDNLDFTSSFDERNVIVEEQWFNVNQSHRRDSSRSFLFWKRTGRFR